MSDVKKILLIIRASNFERQKNTVRAVHQRLKEMGGYALYVFTSYGIYTSDALHMTGSASVYSLLNKMHFDGCILEGNIGNMEFMSFYAEELKKRQIPFVTLNTKVGDAPFLVLDSYEAGCQLVEHLIRDHHCTKINALMDRGRDVIVEQALKAYRDTLKKYDIPVEEKRIVFKRISIPNGRAAYQDFAENGMMDAEAVLCLHDVHAIGLYMELQARGRRVPEDILLCSLNRSTNSIIFRPDITGADRGDEELAKQACILLHNMIQGKKVTTDNRIGGRVYLGQSCGCKNTQIDELAERYQDLILAKIEAGNQISRMMQYNDTLEEVNSLDELGRNIYSMLTGINCSEFICCLNQRDLKYIMNEEEETRAEDGEVFDQTMTAITGMTWRTGRIHNETFPLERLLPIDTEEGDIFIFLPIHHRERVYGYIAIINEYLPIDLYNFRICYESIGSSIENLHRQMILKSSIHELDELHMRDALTGLYNRFALKRFQDRYTRSGAYSVAMIDMDGLKTINDNFGHLSGNHAICITADAIRDSANKDDMVVRCGGDEYLVLSECTDKRYWEEQRVEINRRLTEYKEQQKLPYKLGASIGYAVFDRECDTSFEDCCGRADKEMYEEKKRRKSMR